jgi:pyruvate dehydrogenase E2 component (dihydrolipoamide acetyltransferase)
MAENFLMPKLSPTMEEGQISRWVKNEGETYEANETLAEVDTDKATMEMTALQGGTLLKILKQAGDTAALGEAIAITGKKGEDISALLSEVAANGSSKKEAETKSSDDAAKPSEAPETGATEGGNTSGSECVFPELVSSSASCPTRATIG